MAKTFAGFTPKALTFLRQLQKNNSRDWFIPRKAEFETLLRQPMLELAAFVADHMRSFAVDYVRDPAKAVHRIYRDVRFSKDKTPYKTNISAMFFRAGLSKNTTAGFYFSLSGEAVEIAGGLYMPGPAELTPLRKAIAADPAALQRLLTAPAVVKAMGPVQGESLKRLPRDFEELEEPAVSLLRRRQLYFGKTLDPRFATQPGLDRVIVQCFKAMAPSIEYMNDIFLNSIADSAESEKRPQRPAPMF